MLGFSGSEAQSRMCIRVRVCHSGASEAQTSPASSHTSQAQSCLKLRCAGSSSHTSVPQKAADTSYRRSFSLVTAPSAEPAYGEAGRQGQGSLVTGPSAEPAQGDGGASTR